MKCNCQITRLRNPDGWCVRVAGILDETFTAEDLIANLHGVIVFDMGEVTRATSSGIREWCRALKQLRATYYCFIKCSPIVVSQLNMVSGFAGTGEVVSFQVPYHCPRCDKTTTNIFDLRRDDHQHMVDTLELPAMPCPICGGESEFEDFPEIYFQFCRTVRRPTPPAAASAIIDGKQSRRVFNIEKDPTDCVTGLWLSGSLTRSGYFRRLADGLEGSIVVVTAHLDSISEDGFEGLLEFLRSLYLPCYLARVPRFLLSELAARGGEFGATKLISILARCPCSHCERQVPVDIHLAAARHLLDRDEFEEYCTQCVQRVQPPADRDWIARALSLPWEAPPVDVLSYLEGRPTSPKDFWQAPAPEISRVLHGNYQIQKQLGRGGMGEVFLARRIGPSGFRKPVVIKRLRTDLVNDASIIGAFLEEARLSSRLNHPNIVQTYELLKIPDQYLLVMEYVDGADLRSIISICHSLFTAVPIGMACRIVIDVCQALDAAHNYRHEDGTLSPIIHRDVSPGNILISTDGVVKLADFGIAKAADSLVQTEPGYVKGKTRYIPPESLQPHKDTSVLPRVDVYGVGVLLYECLTCEQFYPDGPNKERLEAILAHYGGGSDTGRDAEVRHRLVSAVERAVAREAEARYQTIRELQEEIENVIEALERPVTMQQLAAWFRDMNSHEKRAAAVVATAGQSVTRDSEQRTVTARGPQLHRYSSPEDTTHEDAESA
ncbi:MAG: serine/threonine protein kinase [Proteobacteria bacterium]|nr:serine/threonine protein kinase [Pseudomonadota bacterium]